MSKKITVLSVLFTLVFASCAAQKPTAQEPTKELANETKKAVQNEVVDLDPEEKGPWDGALYSATTSDENISSSFLVNQSPALITDKNLLDPAVTYEDGLRFYGTGKGMVASAISSDGYSWKIESDKIVQGADPAVQQLADGTYLMVYTSTNFN